MRISFGAGIAFLMCCINILPVWAEPDEISNKECRSCHRFSLNEKYSNKGPDLFYAGNKYYQIWLENFLQSPAVIRELAYSSQLGLLGEKTKKKWSPNLRPCVPWQAQGEPADSHMEPRKMKLEETQSP